MHDRPFYDWSFARWGGLCVSQDEMPFGIFPLREQILISGVRFGVIA